jgi:AhpD family alkylhydroperoxidase
MKLIKTMLAALALGATTIAFAGNDHPILTPMEPESMSRAYTEFLLAQPAFAKNSGFDAKTMQLIHLAAAAGMKCEYCIIAHTAMAKGAGATDEQVKTAIMAAGVVAINSTVLYGNQYDLNELKKMFSK